MTFVFLVFFLAVTAVHTMTKKVHGDEEYEKYQEYPVLSYPFHSISSLFLCDGVVDEYKNCTEDKAINKHPECADECT